MFNLNVLCDLKSCIYVFIVCDVKLPIFIGVKLRLHTAINRADFVSW